MYEKGRIVIGMAKIFIFSMGRNEKMKLNIVRLTISKIC
jgi:hypothetical protein